MQFQSAHTHLTRACVTDTKAEFATVYHFVFHAMAAVPIEVEVTPSSDTAVDSTTLDSIANSLQRVTVDDDEVDDVDDTDYATVLSATFDPIFISLGVSVECACGGGGDVSAPAGSSS